MNWSQAQTRPNRWGQATALVVLAIALLAFGLSSGVTAEEAQIDVELIAVTGSSDYAALTAGAGEAPFAVAMRIETSTAELDAQQLDADVEAALTASFASFEQLGTVANNFMTAFFAKQEPLAEIGEAIFPALAQQTDAAVSVRTDPESGRQVLGGVQ